MKYSSADLKAMARTQLAGKYGIYVGAYVLYSLINYFSSTIVSFALGFNSMTLVTSSVMNNTSDFIPVPKLILFLIITMILSLILSVLMLGFNKMFLDGSRGYPVRFEDLFYGFRHHPDRIILMQLLMVLIYLVCYAPAMVMLIWASLTDASWTFVLIGMLLMLVGSVLIIYFSLSFSQAMYLMADYDDLGPVQALKESQKLMIGNKGRLFYIQLSFLVLELLSLLTCGLASLWIFPYMSMTLTNFYRNLGEEI